MNPRIKGLQRPQQALKTDRCTQISRIDCRHGVEECTCEHRKRYLNPVDEGQSLLRLEPDRLQSLSTQSHLCADPFTVDERLTLADQHQRQMRQRRQVTAGSDRSDPRDPWKHILIEHGDQQLDHFDADSTVSPGQGVGSQCQCKADLLRSQRVSDTRGMGTDQIQL